MLLSSGGDTTVKLVTLALVVVSGGGNFFATKEGSRETERELENAVSRINRFQQENKDEMFRSFQETHELRMELNSSIERQKKALDALDANNKLIDANNKIIARLEQKLSEEKKP
jgi:predicted RNase H-like nuclease (RuvC/YqgF family)